MNDDTPAGGPLPVHQHYTIEGPVDCHVSDCDVYVIQAAARRASEAGKSTSQTIQSVAGRGR
jgi:hypothetical protein